MRHSLFLFYGQYGCPWITMDVLSAISYQSFMNQDVSANYKANNAYVTKIFKAFHVLEKKGKDLAILENS